MKIDRYNLHRYFYLFLPLLLVFFLFSIIEIFLAIGQNDIGFVEFYFFKATNDFWTVFVISILCFPIYILTSFMKYKSQKNIFLVLYSIIIIVQFILVKYSVTTLVNLGADILGYSIEEIKFTLSASKEFSVLEILPCVFLLMLFFDAYFFLTKKVDFKIVFVIYCGLFVYHSVGLLFFKELKDEKYQNKLGFFVTDIWKTKTEQYKLNAVDFNNRKDFPFLRESSNIEDVLSPYFSLDKNKKPNIVIIIVEGLGSEFIGNNAHTGFTPFLTSLIGDSMYWENFVANTGRTFGVLPSVLGSLPMGRNGFLESDQLPNHNSLYSLLKHNGYYTSYYSGDKVSFDKKLKFLSNNHVDRVVDEALYGEEFIKSSVNKGGFSWGYPDLEIYKNSLALISENDNPRLDVIMTLSNHEPFNFPNKNVYLKKIDRILNSNNLKISKNDIDAYKDIYATLLYTDESLEYFFEEYKKRNDYENTIFFITGDHRLIPINQKDKLCRFHVPLFITSPMLKKPISIKAVSSHWDIAPSIVAMLSNNYKLRKTNMIAWLGNGLDTHTNFRNINKIPLMRYKGSINDFMYKNYLLSDDNLYTIKSNFGIFKTENDSIKNELVDLLNGFKKQNNYVMQQNKIMPSSVSVYNRKKSSISKKDLKIILKETDGLNYDEIFFAARDSAFAQKFNKAILLSDYILEEYPNYSDAQILKGRILAWQGKYIEAEKNLNAVLNISPYYSDSYLALLDLYWWSEQDHKSIELMKNAVKNKIKNPDMSFKMAKAFERMKLKETALQIVDSIIKIYPDSLKYKTYKKSLR